LVRPRSYEVELAAYQLSHSVGISLCDGYGFLNTDKGSQYIGDDADGNPVKTTHVDFAEITTSVDGTAGNAELFINCWKVIMDLGDWNNFAWTIKLDPDAVIVADRVRAHLAPYGTKEMYVLNCNDFPSSPEFPMMYGSVEVLSHKAMVSFSSKLWVCLREQAYAIKIWGEDRFTKKCLDMLGVAAVPDFGLVGDGVCLGVDCGSGMAAFHPFKTLDAWKQCWDKATR